MCEDDFILGSEGMELVGRGLEFFAGQFGDSLCDLDVETFGGIQAGADSGAARASSLSSGSAISSIFAVFFQRGAPAADLLRELNRVASWRWVRPLLTMPSVFFFQAFEGSDQLIDCREELILDCQDSRDVHGGREGIVGGLAHIDIIVGVQQLFNQRFRCRGWR